jgi:hypothetical protein
VLQGVVYTTPCSAMQTTGRFFLQGTCRMHSICANLILGTFIIRGCLCGSPAYQSLGAIYTPLRQWELESPWSPWQACSVVQAAPNSDSSLVERLD